MPPALNFILPVAALILALIMAAVLWYWWSSGQADEETDQTAQPEASPSFVSSLRGTADKLWASLRPALSRLSNSASSAIQSRQGGSGAVAAHNLDMIEVLRLYRDLSNGGLVVQVGDQKYRSLEEIVDPQVRRRFLGNAEAMAQFALLKKGTSPLIDWSGPAAEPTATPTSGAAIRSAPPPAALSTASSPAKQEPDKPKSIADEIEDMLQYRLTITPEYTHRSIHIRSTVDGSIYVEVDGQTFDGIGEVSDLPVRSFLQDIIREWEARK
jgi:hypothetical protein